MVLVRALPEAAKLSRPTGEEWDGWTVQTELIAATVDMLAIIAARKQLAKDFRVERPARVDPRGNAANEQRRRHASERARRMVALEVDAQRAQRPEGEFAREIFAKLPGVPASVFGPLSNDGASSPVPGSEPAADAAPAVRLGNDPNFARSILSRLPGVPFSVTGGADG